jgi:hypothetical protein
MKKVKNFKHKVTSETISAIQYVGDSNKFYICEFLKGRKFQVEFAQPGQANMKIALGDDDFFDLFEKQWIFTNNQNELGVIQDESLSDYYSEVN